jgi:hypothetical protein
MLLLGFCMENFSLPGVNIGPLAKLFEAMKKIIQLLIQNGLAYQMILNITFWYAKALHSATKISQVKISQVKVSQ